MKIEYGAGAAFLYPITGRTGTPLFYALMLRNRGYTVMSNHHLRNKELTLKAKFMKLDSEHIRFVLDCMRG